MLSALLKPNYTSDQVNVKIKLPKQDHEMMKAYMAWAKFESESDLFQQALQYVFDTDKSFRRHQQELSMPEVYYKS